MAANPQSFFRFAARYYPLLLDLFYRREGFAEAYLRNLIEGIAADGDSNPSTVCGSQPDRKRPDLCPRWGAGPRVFTRKETDCFLNRG